MNMKETNSIEGQMLKKNIEIKRSSYMQQAKDVYLLHSIVVLFHRLFL